MMDKKACRRVGLLLGAFLLPNWQLDAQAAEFRVLHSFGDGSDGRNPYSAVVSDTTGNLYGTTYFGGANGYGTVFVLAAPKGKKETTLLSFGPGGGTGPYGGLYLDAAGNLFGMTVQGGADDYGTIYELSPDGEATTLHNFTGGMDGSYPYGGLAGGKKGNLYGTTFQGGGTCGGGEGCGTVFSLTPDGTETVLYAFQGGSDGALPYSTPIIDGSGNLYGTTYEGGAGNCGGGGCGTVFKIPWHGSETVLYAFTGGADGGSPTGSLIVDSNGNLFGTAYQGGGTGCGGNGCGTVFEITSNNTFVVLHAFEGGSDGANPSGTLLLDTDRKLFGTTSSGGSTACNGSGCGTIFEITPKGVEKTLYAMGIADTAVGPNAGLTTDTKGVLYGTTAGGGTYGEGTAFEFKK